MSISSLFPISNRADWNLSISLTDAETGETFDSSEITDMQLELEDPDTGCAVLTGSIATGEVTVVDAATGKYSAAFSYTKTASLRQGSYWLAALAILSDGSRRQLGKKEIPVIDGIVGENFRHGYSY